MPRNALLVGVHINEKVRGPWTGSLLVAWPRYLLVKLPPTF